MIRTTMALAFVLVSGVAGAQDRQQPYAGLETRGLKALSAQEIADLRAGRGMSLALAAELNGYPGPAHVLEHADALALTAEQRARTQALFEAMKGEAITLGERLIAEEAALDRAFADRSISAERLAVLTAAIGATQAALRAAHLKYHLVQSDLMTPHQRHRYAELRGYGSAAPGTGHHPGRHHR